MKIYLYKKRIKENNYFLNCYRRLIRSKIIHFLFTLCDIIILIVHEIDIFKRDFKTEIKIEDKIIINPIILIIKKLNSFPDYANFLIVIIPVIVLDSLYIYLCEYNIKNNNMFYNILINFFELFYFRLFVLLFYSALFTLINSYFIIAFIISIINGYLMMNNFLYNHLYSYVPEFVDYPYDEFSSMYDLCLFVSKALISAAFNSTKMDIVKFLFIINLMFQIYFCFYFIQKLFYQSYLFMKNSFLNRTKLSLFLARTAIVIISYLIHKNNLFTILHIFICFDIIIIFMGIIFVYDPFSHIYIGNETPVKNILFYLNVINHRNDVEFLIENKIINHYKGCGLCDLCQKYVKFRKKQNNKDINVKDNENEKDLLVNGENNKIIELFDVLYDDSKKYFKFIFKVIINYKNYGKNSFRNNINYFINFLNLIISDYNNKEINLSYNEKIILEIINKENFLLDSDRLQFNQLVIYNEFNSLVRKILDLMKETLIIEQNFPKIQNLMTLSKLLNEMKDNKFKKYLFNNKLKKITNSQPLLLACSILYEEILNITLNTNNHIAVKDNAVLLEDFSEFEEKNNNMITLEFDIIDFNCKIIRAGKDLFSYINFNLYDLFPPFLKQHQKNLFTNFIFTGFNKQLEKGRPEENLYMKNRKKIEFINFKFIFAEKNTNNSNNTIKYYFKLLNLKFTCLFNNDYKHYILLNGNYSLNKNIVISITDLNHVEEINERIIGVSNQMIENIINKNAFSFKDLNSKRSNYGIKLKKLFSYQISFLLYNIYNLDTKNSVVIQTKSSLKEFRKIANIEHQSESSIKSNSDKKSTVYNDINSISSSINQNANNPIVPARNRKIRKDYLTEYYGGYYKIKRIIYISITFTLLLILVQYLFFYKFQKDEYNCDVSYNNYKSFYRLYNQLFISVLSVACFSETVDSKNCRNIISIFNKFYKRYHPNIFNFTTYMISLNQVLSQKLMEEKANIIKIIDYIGVNKYKELFDKEIKYFQINKENSFSLKEINLRFFDALLILCNSFRFLTENSTYILTQPIYFLNKAENPFTNLKQQNEMSNYQEEMYKLILNYKYFSQQFQIIDYEIRLIINEKIYLLKIWIIAFLNIDTLLFLIIFILLYYYLIYFTKIIIHLLNYILMVINTKDDQFNFCVTFTKKIKNLEAILEVYKVNPIETIKKLNSIYNDYNKYLDRKKSQANLNLNRIKKEKKEMIEIPRHQRVISMKDIKKLNINKKYKFFIIIIVLLIIIIYLCFLLIWVDYFSTKQNLIKVIEKNSMLEKACYEATNIYELMIFNNYTIDEIIDYMNISDIGEFQNNEKNSSNIIFNRFYQQLYFVFDLKKDKEKVGTLYKYFDDLIEFNCSNLYKLIKYDLLEAVDKLLPNIDLKEHLIEVCQFSKIDSSKDIKTLFERHFQYIKSGIISLKDFSYEGLNKNVNDDIIGKVSFFFLSTTIYIIEVTTSKPMIGSIKKIYYLMNKRFLVMEIIFIFFGVVLIVIIIFFYFYNINELYKQIFLLKKTFNIYKSYE